MICNQVLTGQGNPSLDQNQAHRLFSSKEKNLVEAAQCGDLSAFNQLVLTHQDALYHWVMTHVRNDQIAEDITQKTFIIAYQKIHTLRNGSFRAWIFTIARNRSIDEIRHRQRHPSISLDDDSQDENQLDLLSVLPSDSPLPEEAVIQSEQAKLLYHLLNHLPERYREALELVDLLEMDYQEAAAVLNLPLGTLKSRVARARLKLRELFNKASTPYMPMDKPNGRQ